MIELIEIQASLSLESNPWLLRGDFNEITHPEEHSSPAASQISCPMIEFNTCLNQLEVCDPRSLAKFLAPEFSDHTPCCIELDCPTPLAGSKPFKFFNYLTLHPDFLTLVEEAVYLLMRMYSLFVNRHLTTLLLKKNSMRSYCSSPQDIGNLAVAHFLSILGPPTPQTTPVMIDSVAGMIRTNRFSCSPEQAQVSLGCLPLEDRHSQSV